MPANEEGFFFNVEHLLNQDYRGVNVSALKKMSSKIADDYQFTKLLLTDSCLRSGDCWLSSSHT